MKYMTLILLVASFCFGQITTRRITSTTGDIYSTFNEYVAAKGDSSKPLIFQNAAWPVSGRLVVPANLDISALYGNTYFFGVSGSSVDTLVINKMSARPMHQIFDTSVTVVWGRNSVTEYNVAWWGAKADSTTDNSPYFRKCFNSVMASGYGGTIRFNKGQYRMCSTVSLEAPRGIRFVGDMGTVNVNPTIAQGGSDSKIFWDGAASDTTTPMFYFSGGHTITFEHLCIYGGRGSDATNKAFSCIWIDYNFGMYRILYCRLSAARIPLRITSGYNHYTGVWTPGYSQYDPSDSSYAASLVGGFASDNIYAEASEFSYGSIAGVSIESAQSLDNLFVNCLLTYNNVAAKIVACQGIKFDTPTFLVNDSAEVLLLGTGSTGNIIIDNSHSEPHGGLDYLCRYVSTGATYGKVSINNCLGGKVEITGVAGETSIKDSRLAGLIVLADSMSVNIENCFIVYYKRGPVGYGKFSTIINSEITNIDSGSGMFGYHSTFVNSSKFSNWENLSRIPLRLGTSGGYLPALQLGTIPIDTATKGMKDAINFHAFQGRSLSVSNGAYINPSGSWVPTAKTGWNEYKLPPYWAYDVFNDTTGATPAWERIFYLDSLGVLDSVRQINTHYTTQDSSKIGSSGSVLQSVVLDADSLEVTVGGTTKTFVAYKKPLWDDIRINPGSFDRPGTSDPSLVAAGSTYLWEFQINDSATVTVQFPHSYSSRDTVYIHLHWTPGTRGNEEGTATVGWKAGYSWASIDSVFPSWTVADLSDACKSTDWQHLMTPDVAIPGPGKGVSSMLLVNVKRTDTGSDDTWASAVSGQLPILLELDIHYPINKLGTDDH
jgi:hypothetical protein